MNQQNEMKHTPGPWGRHFASTERIDIVTVNKDGEPTGRVACIHRVAWCNEGEESANARLISAAPQLLEALQDALWALEHQKMTDDGQTMHGNAIKQARAALARATTK